MQVTNEIREAFLFAVLNLETKMTTTTVQHGDNLKCFQVSNGTWNHCKGHEMHVSKSIDVATVEEHIRIAFEAKETEELMKWLTLQEKVKFGRKLLALTGGRDLTSDLTEDR